jgi:hypothetical protein
MVIFVVDESADSDAAGKAVEVPEALDDSEDVPLAPAPDEYTVAWEDFVLVL